MNYYQEKLNQIRIALGLETKMAEAMLDDKVTKVEAEAFEPGKKIFVVSEAGEKSPAPEGVHTTEDGTKVTVDSEGTITAVEKPESEEKVEIEIEAEKEEEKMEEEPVKTEKEIEDQRMEKEEMKEMIMQCMEAIEEVAKEVAMVKEEMASYKTKMEKLSKEPASSKISTFSANPMSEKVDALDARVEQLKSLRTSIKPNRKF